MQRYKNHISHLTMYGHSPNVLTVVSSRAAFFFFFLFLSQLHVLRDIKVRGRETHWEHLGDAPLKCWWTAHRSRPVSRGPIASRKPAFCCWQHAYITWPLTGHCSSESRYIMQECTVAGGLMWFSSASQPSAGGTALPHIAFQCVSTPCMKP